MNEWMDEYVMMMMMIMAGNTNDHIS